MHQCRKNIAFHHRLRLLEGFYPAGNLIELKQWQVTANSPGYIRRFERFEFVANLVKESRQFFSHCLIQLPRKQCADVEGLRTILRLEGLYISEEVAAGVVDKVNGSLTLQVFVLTFSDPFFNVSPKFSPFFRSALQSVHVVTITNVFSCTIVNPGTI